ncbi:uncharacterized protein PAC_07223 [Phialocephala subalpina]|uniref:Uncharacterized protein n=1 Tax=Phialocephala subalpina TaxID=576137 RepID=A0A1L7WX42_9HELO|nr:uncharacterized protein PAC_07223 [Phialocephala subalpina]
MAAIKREIFSFNSLQSKTAIITGGANGIGAEVVRLFHSHGANVVIADLPSSEPAAVSLISTLSSRVIFVPTDILNWQNMISLFKQTISTFGSVEIVVANAGIMETKPFYDYEEDENGDLKEPKESYRIIDVNSKGTMNMQDVASAIGQTATDPKYKGACILVSVVDASRYRVKLTKEAFGSILKELEASRTALLSTWMGVDVAELMGKAGALFEGLGGYPLPKSKL